MYENPVKIESPAHYLALKYFLDYYEAERGRLFPKKNSFTSEMLLQLPQPNPTNAERSAIEVYEFIENPPKKYLVYVDVEKKVVTTWVGDVLGRVTWMGSRYKSSFGDKRVNFGFRGINGYDYYGTHYCSSGDYARVRQKSSRDLKGEKGN